MLVRKQYDLSQAFQRRLAYKAAGILVTRFTGVPDSVFLKLQDLEDPISLARGVRAYNDTPLNFSLWNKQAQPGAMVELLMVSPESLGALSLYDLPNPNLVQETVTVTNTVKALPAHYVGSGLSVILSTPTTNTKPVYVGDSSVSIGTGIRLDPGSSFSYIVPNSEQIHAVAASTQSLIMVIGQSGPSAGVSYNPTGVVSGSLSIGTTATQFPAQAVPSGITVVVVGDYDNNDNIYVGGTDVTVSTGIELQAGSSIRLTVSDVSAIYAVASVTGQKARYIVEVNS